VSPPLQPQPSQPQPAQLQPLGSKIILLNGSSSSGKTTLARKLQQLLPGAYQHIALDQFRDGLPDRYRGLNSPAETPGAQGMNVVPRDLQDERVTAIEFGSHGEQMLCGMRRAVAAFASQGNNVIVDDLLFKPQYLHDYAVALTDYQVWCVGVRCSLARVNEREGKRPGRFPGTATSHYHQVHAHDLAYDVEVDTTDLDASSCARSIIARLQVEPTALQQWLIQHGNRYAT
jgi:chloramphenicol 3-O phosphotransferase